MTGFKNFLLNEEKSYLGHRVGDVLTAAQELQQDMENLGSRHLNRLAERVVNQIRKILHSQWSSKSQKHLQSLQRIAVAIMKTIDEKGDLKEILPTAVQELQNLSGQLGVKVNNLEGPEEMGGEEVSQADFQQTGDGPAPPQQQPPAPGMQDPMGGGGMPPMGGAAPPQMPPMGGAGGPPMM